ncbi:hypothetical protein [Pseudokineococcus sp. 1T1Z-3]|uniref:hypothetical protein n=1 Tax=Pseudokineococcus sp. 1T1Z-3 TaxID=3132745 RepID=UPI0030A22CEB
MDGQETFRRERAELVARAERLRLWARLVRARTDLLVAQLCPPTGEEGELDEDVAALAALVLRADGAPLDRTEHLLALREARDVLRLLEDELYDRLCWSTAQMVLDSSTDAAVGRRDGEDARVIAIPRPRPAHDPGGDLALPAGTASPPDAARGWHTPA